MKQKFNLFPKNLRIWQKESFTIDLEQCDWVVNGSVELHRVDNGWVGTFTNSDGEISEAFPARCNKCHLVIAHFGNDASASCECGNFDECPGES